MKKLFTFVFCAFCALSVWGKEYTIGSGDGVSYNTPLTTGTYHKCFTQQLYLASELTAAGASAGTIKALYFQSKTYASSTYEPYTKRTNFKVYITTTSSSTLTSFVTEKGTEVFSSTSLTITSGSRFVGDLSTIFPWNGTDNIIVTVVDNSNVKIGGGTSFSKGFKAFSVANRGVYFADESYEGTIDLSSKTNSLSEIPIIIFDIEGSTPSPSITPSTETLDFGSFYPAGETVSQTFTVTASNLTKDITLATTANGVTISPTSIEKDNADLAGKGVEVTVTLGSGYTFTSGTKLSITSDGANTKEIALKATEVRDEDFYKPSGYTFFIYENATKSPYIGYVSYTAGNLTISEVANNHFKPYNNAGFMVDYSSVNTTCENSGKVTNLRGKFISETEFRAFSFDYMAPEQTGIVIDEDEDKSSTWPEEAQSGKSLIIKRAIVPNQWNSIVLPTYLTSTEVESVFGSGTDLEEFTNAVVTSSNITLNFTKKTNGLEAGVPYLIKPTQAIANPLNLTNHSFTKIVTPVDNNGIRFDGVLVPTVIDGGDGSDYIIVGANNTLFHPTGEGTIKGMRAYFHVIGTEAKAALKTAKISMNTGSTTEMVLIKDSQTKPYKTMVNDQIVIVNEGKQINILGQTVK